ncbi:DMT family transporter [Virgibacillus kekensis]|uniref:DMT family transporter n=1 Tax=Virgibacillus kekensis TaxID=202261 RepID=A0ABV9DIM7_9BACI
MNRKKGITFVLIGAASFGFTPVFVKLGYQYGYTLGQINIAQMTVALALLWGIILFRRPSVKSLNTLSVLKIFMTGSCVGLTSIFYYGAMIYLPASMAIILLFQFVWIGIILDWVIGKNKPTRATYLAIVLIIFGVIIASNITAGNAGDFSVIGFLLGICSAFSYAGFIYFSGKTAIKTDPLLRSALMVTGSALLILLVFAKEMPALPVTELNLWSTAAGLAFFGAVMPTLLFASGAHLISGGLANILSSIELPVAIISASIILSETITTGQWTGTILIIMAIILNEWRSLPFPIRKKRHLPRL